MRRALLLFFVLPALAADVTVERLNHAEKEPQNWLHYYGAYKAWRYSPLDQINATNVNKLAPVWAFESGQTDGGMQSTPVVVDGVMYVSTAWNHIFALDAKSGERIWRYDYPVAEEIPASTAPGTAASPCGAIWSSWARSTTIWSPSTPRPARRPGESRLKMPNSAAATSPGRR